VMSEKSAGGKKITSEERKILIHSVLSRVGLILEERL
jgi:hypothetical protein